MWRAARAALAALWLVTACSGDPSGGPSLETERSVSRSALLPLPEPDLAALEGAVRQELVDARADFEGRSDDPGETDEARASGFGELGKLYLAHSLLEPAAVCFRNARALAPAEFRWPYYLGRTALRQNDPETARAAFEQARALRPEHPPTLIALGELDLDRNATELSQAHFERALALNPASAAALVGLGRLAAAEGHFETAAGRFEEALRLEPQATAVHYSLALAYRELGEVELARRHLELRGERPPSEADPLMAEVAALATGARVHLLRAGRALAAGRLDQGTAELSRAIEIDPADASTRVTLGAILAQRADPSGAREQFETALRLAPGDSRAHYNLGLLAVEEGDDRGSIEQFRSALAADPGHERAAFQLGEALMRLGQESEAIEALARARELAPASETVRLREVAALAGAGRYPEARARLEEARVALPSSAPLKHALARLLAAAPDGDVRDGVRALELATEVARDGGLFEGRIHFEHGQTLALAYAETGQFDRAVALQEALVAAADRDGRLEALPALRETLALFRSGSPGRLSSMAGDPFLPTAAIKE